MKTNVSVHMDKALIDFAKRHAKKHGTSVSHLVANYFEHLPDVAEVTKTKKQKQK